MFCVFHLNEFSAGLASGAACHSPGLFVATETTSNTIGNVEDTTIVESPLEVQSDSTVKRLGLKTDVSVDMTGVATLTVGEVEAEQSRDRRLPVFAVEAAETPLSLTVASVKRAVGDSSNVLLELQREGQVLKATAWDGRLSLQIRTALNGRCARGLASWDGFAGSTQTERSQMVCVR